MPPDALDVARSRFRQSMGDRAPAAALYAEGVVLLHSGRAEDAAVALLAALEADPGPNTLRVLQALGQAWYRAGRFDDAWRAFDRILGHTDLLLDPFVWQGLTLLALGRPADALALHRRALARHPDHADITRIHADGAVALYQLGRYADGLAWCQLAVEERGLTDPVLVRNLAGFRQLLEGE